MPHVVGQKGQVVIAKEIRDLLGITPGWMATCNGSSTTTWRSASSRPIIVRLKGTLAPYVTRHISSEDYCGSQGTGVATCGRAADAWGFAQYVSDLIDTSVVVSYRHRRPASSGRSERPTDRRRESSGHYRRGAVGVGVFAQLGLRRSPRARRRPNSLRCCAERTSALFPTRKEQMIEALQLCRPSGRVSFGDAMIWAAARFTGRAVFTLDERFPDVGITRHRLTDDVDPSDDTPTSRDATSGIAWSARRHRERGHVAGGAAEFHPHQVASARPGCHRIRPPCSSLTSPRKRV